MLFVVSTAVSWSVWLRVKELNGVKINGRTRERKRERRWSEYFVKKWDERPKYVKMFESKWKSVIFLFY